MTDQPDLTDTKVVVQCLPDVITITEAHTQFADGRVELLGSVGLSDPKNPILALQLKAAQALFARNESMIVRGNADVRVLAPDGFRQLV